MINSFFNPDFYPTPSEVIERMLSGVIIADKVVLEPSAGNGNIVEYCKQAGAKEVVACEINDNLRKMLSAKCHIIESDFLNLTADRVSHVDLIIMNPPFSAEEKHIMHAWDIAPAGCQIISLCNSNMLKNRYSESREIVRNLIEANGRHEDFGRCFGTSERKTDVEVSCMWLFKPGTAENEFEGYFDLYDYEQDACDEIGIVKYDFVKDIVSRYVEAVSMFNEVEEANARMSRVIAGVTDHFSIKFGANYQSRDKIYSKITRDTFKKELQKAAWNKIFGMMKMDKYVTSGVMADINKFVEQQVHVPFTVKNVYLMVQMIAGTHDQRMDRVIVEAFEKICSYSYENCTAGEGWRTNSDFTINKRFILPYMVEINYAGGIGINYRRADQMDDIVKALCYMTATDYDKQIRLEDWFRSPYKIKCDGRILTGYGNSSSNPEDYSITSKVKALKEKGHDVEIYEVERAFGAWVEWNDFFVVRGYKKGTLHVEFKDEDLWATFNQRVAKIKGWKNMVTHSKKGRAAKKKKTA